jgi:hypothetical protein
MDVDGIEAALMENREKQGNKGNKENNEIAELKASLREKDDTILYLKSEVKKIGEERDFLKLEKEKLEIEKEMLEKEKGEMADRVQKQNEEFLRDFLAIKNELDSELMRTWWNKFWRVMITEI